jgi:thiamine biosynthesis protein ThiI
MIIVRYGEIGLKSPQVRRKMERQLVKNIKKAVGVAQVSREHGRIFVDLNSREDAQLISRVFGVVSTSVAIKTSSEMDVLLKKGLEFAKESLKGKKSFAIRARRKGVHDYKSVDIAKFLGSLVVNATSAGVDLEDPDVTVYVEVRDRNAYIFDEIIGGVGGLPLGTQGKVLALVSGGIDSPVAAWMMMKRGVSVEALFMDCRPLVDNRTIERAKRTIEILGTWTNTPIKTHFVPYGEALLEFLKYGDNKLGCILCKRIMYRVGEKIARAEKALALVTGESLGQVASQTLQNLNTIETGVDVPIFRPLIGVDKTEIVDLAKKIGTYEASIMPANCCLGPPIYPETKSEFEKVSKAEETLDMMSMVKEVLEKAVVLEIEHGKG